MDNPLKPSLKSEIVPLLILAASIVLGIYFYYHFPAVVVSHWGFNGEPNGYSSGTANAIAIPALIAGMYLLFLFLPMLDPKKERYADFAGVYNIFRSLIMGCLLAVFFFTGLYNLGYPIQISLVVPLIIGLLMIILGNYMGKLKKNWFVGIKTPWTLSSENVWNKTHRMGGLMFIIFGLIIIAAPWLPKFLGLALFILGIILVTFGTMAYSYWEFKKEQGAKGPINI